MGISGHLNARVLFPLEERRPGPPGTADLIKGGPG